MKMVIEVDLQGLGFQAFSLVRRLVQKL